MGLDDDADCVAHLWGVAELHLTARGAEMVSTCERCSAVLYEPSGSGDPTRPPL